METHSQPATARGGIGLATVVAALSLLAGTSLAVASDEPEDPAQELSRLRTELAAVTTERDALLQAVAAREGRYERSSATQQTIIDIIADPAAFGTEDAVLDLLDGLAVPGTTMDDVALGEADWRDAWWGTLFGAQADIHTWTKWMAEDGSVGGSLWTWSGTAVNGAPFEIPGIDVSRYDDNGLTTSAVVHWPYGDAEVECVFYQGSEMCAERDG